jgi:hypothetical protein
VGSNGEDGDGEGDGEDDTTVVIPNTPKTNKTPAKGTPKSAKAATPASSKKRKLAEVKAETEENADMEPKVFDNDGSIFGGGDGEDVDGAGMGV